MFPFQMISFNSILVWDLKTHKVNHRCDKIVVEYLWPRISNPLKCDLKKVFLFFFVILCSNDEIFFAFCFVLLLSHRDTRMNAIWRIELDRVICDGWVMMNKNSFHPLTQSEWSCNWILYHFVFYSDKERRRNHLWKFCSFTRWFNLLSFQ